MMSYNAYQQYKEQSVTTMTPGELVVLMYDTCITNINKAIWAIKNKHIADTHTYIVKAEDVILMLRESLDSRYPISENLSSLYQFFYNQLLSANIKKDEAPLNEILPMIVELRNSFKQAEKLSRQGS